MLAESSSGRSVVGTTVDVRLVILQGGYMPATPLALDKEQRTAIGVEQSAHVLKDLMAQRSDVQLVTYILNL